MQSAIHTSQRIQSKVHSERKKIAKIIDYKKMNDNLNSNNSDFNIKAK